MGGCILFLSIAEAAESAFGRLFQIGWVSKSAWVPSFSVSLNESVSGALQVNISHEQYKIGEHRCDLATSR